eukprot:NODE_5370_length_1778_cov_4.545730.p1 GENE.NODE_5370_length_1778_cov_4.545730~~NODE_5370_length_1778_cov_4.545730.p1  ORF type:complete len:493 (+),score=78.62 NODE_5370_length_1778_cov_4.545730:174-1481(+)
MGMMYAFSVFITEALEGILSRVYIWILGLAVLALPFGRKRLNCDHRRPSLWNSIWNCLGCPSRCAGECMREEEYTLDQKWDDVAWSVYILDVGVWLYIFLSLLWATAMFIWSFVLWLAVLLVLLVVGVAMLCGLCVMAGGDCGGLNLEGCSCDGCCFDGAASLGAADASGESSMFFVGGAYPLDPFWGSSSGYSSIGDRGPSCCWCCERVCKPLAWLLYLFPVLPENAWGGLCGFLMGTHPQTPTERIYQNGSAFKDFMAMRWRRRADLHNHDQWRRLVFQFLNPDADAELGHRGPPPLRAGAGREGVRETNTLLRQPHQRHPSPGPPVESEEIDGQTVLTIGSARVIKVNRPFTKHSDHCFPSSYTDYVANKCWICMGGAEEWDLWLSCNHLFCKVCSTEMLKRGMPCPLCRAASSTALRGFRHTGNMDGTDSE